MCQDEQAANTAGDLTAKDAKRAKNMRKACHTPVNFTSIDATTKISITSVNCVQCGLPNSLDAKGVCSHCRVSRKGDTPKTVWEMIKHSIFKDLGERRLPPSVITD